jgi:sugar/nucleoside kinase (ribokinase family)
LNQMLSGELYREEADGLDLFGLSRYLQRRGEAERAEVACTAARERGLPIAFDALAQWELARMAKRRGEHETAAQIWEELARDDDWRVAACEELATFHERRHKDVARALKYTRQAIVTLRKRAMGHKCGAQAGVDLRKFERLEKKMARLELRLRKATDAPPLLRTPRKSTAYREPDIAG